MVKVTRLSNTRFDKEQVNVIIDDFEVKSLKKEALFLLVKHHITTEIAAKNVHEFSFKDEGFRHAAVNYLRHKQSNYDLIIDEIQAKTSRKMVEKLKEKVLKDIAKKYPYLRNECLKQRLKI